MIERKVYAKSDFLMILFRFLIIISIIGLFIAGFNPARLSELINKNASLFTSAILYKTIGGGFIRALNNGWITQGPLTLTYMASVIVFLGILALATSGCLSVGEVRMRKLAMKAAIIGSGTGLVGMALFLPAYQGFVAADDRVRDMFPIGIFVYGALLVVVLVLAFINLFKLPAPADWDKYEMQTKYKLFLLILPFLALCIVFSYLPLWGWRYSFFTNKLGSDITMDDFVGFYWLSLLFKSAATRRDIARVLKNTLGLSGIGIAMSWLPLAFAIFLSEMVSGRSKRLVQSLTTIPNFISWVLVYTVAFALFSGEGFVNMILIDLGVIEEGTNFLMSGKSMWIKMWAWGTWKGLGWGAIIYIAAISGIDPQLYEAATVDGANRYRKMWHITVPGLVPTYCVLLLMSIASILSNGMDQYLVFTNPQNRSSIEVLDLYVYNLGLGSGGSSNIPLATLIGMLKSIISVSLLLVANKISALIRGTSIV